MTIQKLPMGKDDHVLHGLDPLKHFGALRILRTIGLDWLVRADQDKETLPSETSVGRSVKCVLWVRAEVNIGLQFIRRESR
jgi:hypothetical protein